MCRTKRNKIAVELDTNNNQTKTFLYVSTSKKDQTVKTFQFWISKRCFYQSLKPNHAKTKWRNCQKKLCYCARKKATLRLLLTLLIVIAAAIRLFGFLDDNNKYCTLSRAVKIPQLYLVKDKVHTDLPIQLHVCSSRRIWSLQFRRDPCRSERSDLPRCLRSNLQCECLKKFLFRNIWRFCSLLQ